MADEDRTIVCAVCATEFVWTSGEQEFYARHGFLHPPRKCKGCRDTKVRVPPRARVRAAPAHHEMIGTPGRRSGVASQAGARSPIGPVSVEANCSACGALAQLPFRPDGIRPVYCRRCLKERRSTPTGRA